MPFFNAEDRGEVAVFISVILSSDTEICLVYGVLRASLGMHEWTIFQFDFIG